jgi:hypothetical protein
MKINYAVKECFINYSNICLFLFYNLFLGVVSLGLNAYALFKMTKYYRKLNFDNIIVLLSFLDLIFFLIDMILIEGILYYIFIFIRIFIICLINLKFVKASKEFLKIKYYWINYLIIAFNFIFLIARITLLELYINNDYDASYYDIKIYVNFSSYFIELIALGILIFYCRKYLILIKQKMHNETESYNLQQNEEEFDSINPMNGNKKNITLFDFNMDNRIGSNELYFKSKKNQIMLLFLMNIILSIISLIISLIIRIIIASYKSGYEKYNYTIKVLGYISDLIEIFQNLSICLSFYWIIRKQYDSNNENNKVYEEINLINGNIIQQNILYKDQPNIK